MAHTKAFPRAVEEFENDERIAFDNSRGTYILEDFDGKEYEFNDKFSTWVEQMNDELVKAQQSVYYKSEEVNDQADESVIDKNKKRKAELKAEAKENKKAKKTSIADTSVYVSGLPLDATLDEIREQFKRCGIFALSIDDETERIKLYANEDGSFKGEALITYFRPESVQMAIDMLDGTDLRTFMSGDMRVQKADMSYKKNKEYQADASDKKKAFVIDREKVRRIAQERSGRLADWSSDEEPQALVSEKPKNKHDKTVVVKHMFTLDDIKDDPDFRFELEEDIIDEAKEKGWGDVIHIDIFDLEPEGVVRVRFRDPESAAKALSGMDGRLFDGRRLVAYVPDRKEKWRKSERDEEEEEERRLRKYGEQLERGEA